MEWALDALAAGGRPLTEDGPLVEAARGGDAAAFAALYRRWAPVVHGVLLAAVPRGDVEDLVQDVFHVALRRLDTLRDPSAFGPWLLRVARNRGNDFHRRSVPTQALPDEVAGPEGPTVEAREVLAALRALPAAYRETLALRLVEGMTGPEIAAATGMTPGSVRVNLHRGMKRLRAILEGGRRRA